MILSLVFLAVSQMTGSCVLTEGVGSDFAHIGVVPERHRIRRSHLTFTFNKKGVLDAIFVFPGGDVGLRKASRSKIPRRELEPLDGER